ncbi:LytTR family transcriptional regulator DNA-binding domain-containing protein [Paenibacillus polymyxa]|uniref:LytTR family transcriptional regulator DNA-binding domain-containing protein n=1 Tax=Paenibacillus polymyxa TaxID=1406 RepID=UPI0025B6BBD3|nr:LytTR family transcriptional regulator DNA-binding domain-containing protein [Paenibacillus polymyxa]MDN4090981.1 dipeptidyl aminopeptidase [Paenibacillus polymyxa]
MIEDDHEIFGTEVVEVGELGRVGFFKVSDIFFVDVFKPKKNYEVPRFHTKQGIFTVTLTLSDVKEGLPSLTVLDGGRLINLKNVDFIEETPYGPIVHFLDTDYTTQMAQRKLKYFRHLVKKEPKIRRNLKET